MGTKACWQKYEFNWQNASSHETEQEVGHSYPLKCTSSIKAVASKDYNFPINSAAGE